MFLDRDYTFVRELAQLRAQLVARDTNSARQLRGALAGLLLDDRGHLRAHELHLLDSALRARRRAARQGGCLGAGGRAVGDAYRGLGTSADRRIGVDEV